MRKSSDNWLILRKNDSASMPLWHNKDKSENPCGATGLLLCPYSFSTKKDPQIGAEKGGDK